MKKGFVDWLSDEYPDVICIQETKANKDQVEFELIENLGYKTYWFSAQKKGYSGVAIFSKQSPNHVEYGTGIDYMDFEGRVLRIDFDQVSVMSLYLPSGTNTDRLEFKFRFMYDFKEYIYSLNKEIKNLVICGDYNICHNAIDIHDPVRNKNVSGGGHNGGGIFISSEDHGRFGLLFLNKGIWDGKRVISEEWIQKSITPSETNPEYGYMWWINSELGEDYQTTDWKNVPTNIFYGSGFGGNKVIIIPDENMVVVGRWFGKHTESTFIKMILDSK